MTGRPGPRLAALLGVPLVSVLLLAGPPPDPAAAPVATARAEGSSATITVTELTPRTVTPEATVTVTGTVTNTADVALTDVVLRLQRGPVLTTRDDLAANDADPSPAGSAVAPFAPLTDSLPARSSVPFSYSATAAELGLTELGVYPLLVNVNATPEGDVEQRVGELDTYLPFFPETPTEPTSVAWLWPLVDRPHRAVDGSFADDDLTDSVAVGGRLERLLEVAEAGPGVSLTLVVDPLLLSELQQMVGGYTLQDGTAGRGGAQAAAWLDRLGRLADVHPVIALPWADADVVALTRAGMGDRATDAVTLGASTVADVLGSAGTLAWPADGAVTSAALRIWEAAGITGFVLDAAAAGDPPSAARTPGASAELTGPDTEVAALLTDPALQEIVSGADRWPDGPRLAEQRYLAELAMITAEAPAQGRMLLVAPPRRWDARASYALPMLGDPAREPWLASVDTDDLVTTTPVDRGSLTYPDDAAAAELDPAGLARLRQADGLLTDFSAMLVREDDDLAAAADELVDPLAVQVLTAAGGSARGDAATVLARAERVRQAVAAQRSRVSLVVPADGVYSLASARTALVFTVANDLPVPVQVRIGVDASLVAGLSLDGSVVQVVQPGSRALLEVPAEVERRGEFRVTAELSSPAGLGLGNPVQLTVRSTVYGGLSLAITAAAAALLALLFALRLVRWVRHRRRRVVPGLTPPRESVGSPR